MGIPLFPSADSLKSNSEKFPSTDNIEKLFKERYDYEHRRKENLDKKANNVLVGASTAITIYGGFGVLAETNFFTNSIGNDFSLISLIIGLFAILIGIVFSILALSLRDYWTVLNLKDFGELLNDKFFVKLENIDELRKNDPTLLSSKVINGYVEFSLRNKKINDGKAKWIIVSQLLFIIGIASIPLYLLTL